MELGPTAYVILGMLALGPRSGYDIKQFADFSTRHFWATSYGQIYPELKRLTEAGLVGRNAALAFPLVPLRIGLVASRGSAAWHDVRHELEGSGIGFRLAHVDVRVQGEEAAAAVASAVRTLSRRPLDVIVIVRGGGSRTDLAAFDDERVALAIARAPVPVLTGLGHEVDRSVADHVAHTAYKTPTACAADSAVYAAVSTGSANCWRWCHWTRPTPTADRTNSPAASSSESPWAEPWPASPT